ncbi:MAG TPA: hypothetical protein VEL76_02425, partial [Gemmataceae bacterium]|nr:hypothetical protein [Gemmataceae bacterium]
MPRRAYSYAHISDRKQGKGDGLRRQGAAQDESGPEGALPRETYPDRICREQGWCLDDSLRFVDKGRSAYHGDNLRIGDL